ncbi:MAG: hypothetical protein ABR497_08815 [Kiritimatiellia bacterium]|nr:hypothetical protein [Lentisphaerota bacterium]
MAYKKNLGAWYAAAGLFLFALLVFRSVLPPDAVFFCSDSNVGTTTVRKSLLPGAFAA